MQKLSFSSNVVPMNINLGDEIILSLKATQELTVGAMSWIIDYPEDVVEIVDVMLPPGMLVKNAVDLQHHLRIAWVCPVSAAGVSAAELVPGVSFGGIKVKVIKKPEVGAKIALSVVDTPETEFGDENAQSIPGVVIQIDVPEQLAAVTVPDEPDPEPVTTDPVPASGTPVVEEEAEPLVETLYRIERGSYLVTLDKDKGVTVKFVK